MIGKLFEKIIWYSRLIIVVPVIAGIISAIVMVILGTTAVYRDLIQLPRMFQQPFTAHYGHLFVLHIISAVDAYLMATVLLIFSIGLYELFVRKIEEGKRHPNTARVLVIQNLDQLKEKIAKLIIMVLIITYFKSVVGFEYNNVWELLYLSIGILLISLAIFFTHKTSDKH